MGCCGRREYGGGLKRRAAQGFELKHARDALCEARRRSRPAAPQARDDDPEGVFIDEPARLSDEGGDGAYQMKSAKMCPDKRLTTPATPKDYTRPAECPGDDGPPEEKVGVGGADQKPERPIPPPPPPPPRSGPWNGRPEPSISIRTLFRDLSR
jgi:hypothetical protein